MLTPDRRQARLRHLMLQFLFSIYITTTKHALAPIDIATLVYRNFSRVHLWRLLELELCIGERIERAQMDSAATEG